MNNKYKGNLAVASAIAHFVAKEYTVSIPLADTAKYDLVVERESRFFAVQCKYAGYKKSPNIFAVPLYVSGGNRSAGNRRIKYQINDFDLLFVLCANGQRYVIPFEEIAGQTTINLGRTSKWSKWEKYLLSVGKACRSIEESIEQFSSNSVEPLEDGNAEPSL